MIIFGPFGEFLIILAAAIIAVLVFQRLKASPVVGYLVAGVIIGPSMFGWVGSAELAETLGHFGVVFLMFSVGLEMPLNRIWLLRRLVFGLGIAQILVTGTLIGAIVFLLTENTQTAIVVGICLAFSSTAIVLRLLAERAELVTLHGRASIGILLMQDLAVVPMLSLIPLMEGAADRFLPALGDAALEAALAIAVVFILGRTILRPALRAIAATGNTELFALAAILLVLGTGSATEYAGLSMELGAFLAGMMLADTEYNHQVEADIAPYKALLLSLFFISVGMTINFHLLVAEFGVIVLITLALIVGKSLIIAPLGRLFGLSWAESARTAILLCSGSEFAFVLLGLAVVHGAVFASHGQLLVASIALSMVVVPFLGPVSKRLDAVLAQRRSPRTAKLSDVGESVDNHIILAGFGRFGQIISRVLDARRIPWIAIDNDIRLVGRCRRLGLPVFFGISTHRQVLAAAGFASAQGLIITFDDTDRAVATVRAAREISSETPVMARSHDPSHSGALEQVGADTVVPESIESCLQLAAVGLREAGLANDDIDRLIAGFRQDPDATLEELAARHRAVQTD